MKGNSEGTIAFLDYLQHQYGEARIALIWDGAASDGSSPRVRVFVGQRRLKPKSSGGLPVSALMLTAEPH